MSSGWAWGTKGPPGATLKSLEEDWTWDLSITTPHTPSLSGWGFSWAAWHSVWPGPGPEPLACQPPSPETKDKAGTWPGTPRSPFISPSFPFLLPDSFFFFSIIRGHFVSPFFLFFSFLFCLSLFCHISPFFFYLNTHFFLFLLFYAVFFLSVVYVNLSALFLITSCSGFHTDHFTHTCISQVIVVTPAHMFEPAGKTKHTQVHRYQHLQVNSHTIPTQQFFTHSLPEALSHTSPT